MFDPLGIHWVVLLRCDWCEQDLLAANICTFGAALFQEIGHQNGRVSFVA